MKAFVKEMFANSKVCTMKDNIISMCNINL